jgi:hypothetical protein
MTYEETNQFYAVLLIAAIFVLYLLRNTNPIFGGIWRIIRLFGIVLFVTLFANYAKKEVKEWWNKD